VGAISLLGGDGFFRVKAALLGFISHGYCARSNRSIFLFGIQLMFIGVLGEYIGTIHTYVQRRPIVVEKERVNFDK